MKRRLAGDLGLRIAVAAFLVALTAVFIVAVGTLVVGAQSFLDLMTADGHPANESQAMFDASVGRVVVVAVVIAVAISIVLAILLARQIARPLRALGNAAQRIAGGDYAARVPVEGPDEITALAGAFNEMAVALEEQERLRREFVANAAHELKTPLTNLQGYLEALRDEVIPADRETFQSLLDEGERLARLARSLDTLPDAASTSIHAELIEVDAADIARRAADLAAPSFVSAGLAFEVDLSRSLPVLADPDGLSQVIGNLLQNALRYAPAPGRVWLRGERRKREVWIAVANTGPGIPAADIPHVFERFYRVDKSRDVTSGGAGIGLAIVRETVRSFGGDVGIDSSDGRTDVWFSLPAMPTPSRRRRQAE
jgi:signal transduction histidine kinase